MFKISGPTASIAVVAALVLSGIGASLPIDSAARADDCAAAPKTVAPAGQHWYYRTDRVNHRKCWYLHPTVALPHQATAQPAAAAAESGNADPPAQPATSAESGNADPPAQPTASSESVNPAPQPATSAPPSASDADSMPPAPGNTQSVPPSGSDGTQAAPHVTVLTVRPVPEPFVGTTTQSQQPAAENVDAPPMPQTLPQEQSAADSGVNPTDSAGNAPLRAVPDDVAHHHLAQIIAAARGAARTRSGQIFLVIALALGIVAIFIAIVGKIAGPYRTPRFADHPDAAWIRYRNVHRRSNDEAAYDEISDGEQDVPFLDPEPDHGLADLDAHHWIDQSSPSEAGFQARSQDVGSTPAAPATREDIELALRILRQARQSGVA
jgi:hypothetical protein